MGVSYNVRHFISPEEVNAIEKKFSYQKKKKKGEDIDVFFLSNIVNVYELGVSWKFIFHIYDIEPKVCVNCFDVLFYILVANFDPSTFSVMRCEFCSAGFDTRAGLSSHARAHLRDFGITNWEVTVSPINILRELFAKHPDLVLPTSPTHTLQSSQEQNSDKEQESRKDMKDEEDMFGDLATLSSDSAKQLWKEKHNISEPEGKRMGFTSWFLKEFERLSHGHYIILIYQVL